MNLTRSVLSLYRSELEYAKKVEVLANQLPKFDERSRVLYHNIILSDSEPQRLKELALELVGLLRPRQFTRQLLQQHLTQDNVWLAVAAAYGIQHRYRELLPVFRQSKAYQFLLPGEDRTVGQILDPSVEEYKTTPAPAGRRTV